MPRNKGEGIDDRDWFKIKKQFLAFGGTLEAFGRVIGVPGRTVRKRYDADGWEEARERFRQKASIKIENKIEERLVQEISDYFDTFTEVHKKAKEMLKNPKLITRPYHLKDLAVTLDISLKNHMLIGGRATSRVGFDDKTTEALKGDRNAIERAITTELAEIEAIKTRAKAEHH